MRFSRSFSFMLLSIKEHLAVCARQHGHICPGQVLGVRMALLGCKSVSIYDPLGEDRKNLLIWVEIDRCLTDAISAVTGTRLGKRSMKFVDYGKTAATFHNIRDGVSRRLSVYEDSREKARRMYPESGKREGQMLYYERASDDELFKIEKVSVRLKETDEPGSPKRRVLCTRCFEGVNDGREVHSPVGEILCKPCAAGGYYEPAE